MTRHVLKLIWNRKKTNALVILEIFISFVVVFAVMAAMTIFATNYRQPLGFDYEEVITISVDLPAGTQEENATRMETLVGVARGFTGVEEAAAVQFEPYFEGRNTGAWESKGQTIRFDRNYVTDEFADVMGIHVVEGRWFSREDVATETFRPVVIDRDFATTLFGGENAVGRELDPGAERPMRVVGVIDDFRAQGEFSPRNNYVFLRGTLGLDANRIVVKMQPGIYDGDFENRLLRQLERVVPGASFGARLMTQQRAVALRVWFVPLLIAALIGAFLVLMVALGLTGVMWQNVTQRTRELGLRRAIGAERGRVRRQILAEISLIVTLGLILGVAVVTQIPLMRLFTFLDATVFGIALTAALSLMYALALVCGLYPSWLASRIEPAEALHYE